MNKCYISITIYVVVFYEYQGQLLQTHVHSTWLDATILHPSFQLVYDTVVRNDEQKIRPRYWTYVFDISILRYQNLKVNLNKIKKNF